MSESWKIVPMAKEHIGSLARLEQLCFSEPWSEEGLLAELFKDTARFLVALEQGRPAGYLGLHVVCGEGYIANLAVYPQYRRRGVARALLERAAGEAPRLALEFLTLEVRASNQAAISLYEGEGFELQGFRKGFYANPREDAAIYTKRFDGCLNRPNESRNA